MDTNPSQFTPTMQPDPPREPSLRADPGATPQQHSLSPTAISAPTTSSATTNLPFHLYLAHNLKPATRSYFGIESYPTANTLPLYLQPILNREFNSPSDFLKAYQKSLTADNNTITNSPDPGHRPYHTVQPPRKTPTARDSTQLNPFLHEMNNHQHEFSCRGVMIYDYIHDEENHQDNNDNNQHQGIDNSATLIQNNQKSPNKKNTRGDDSNNNNQNAAEYSNGNNNSHVSNETIPAPLSNVVNESFINNNISKNNNNDNNTNNDNNDGHPPHVAPNPSPSIATTRPRREITYTQDRFIENAFKVVTQAARRHSGGSKRTNFTPIDPIKSPQRTPHNAQTTTPYNTQTAPQSLPHNTQTAPQNLQSLPPLPQSPQYTHTLSTLRQFGPVLPPEHAALPPIGSRAPTTTKIAPTAIQMSELATIYRDDKRQFSQRFFTAAGALFFTYYTGSDNDDYQQHELPQHLSNPKMKTFQQDYEDYLVCLCHFISQPGATTEKNANINKAVQRHVQNVKQQGANYLQILSAEQQEAAKISQRLCNIREKYGHLMGDTIRTLHTELCKQYKRAISVETLWESWNKRQDVTQRVQLTTFRTILVAYGFDFVTLGTYLRHAQYETNPSFALMRLIFYRTTQHYHTRLKYHSMFYDQTWLYLGGCFKKKLVLTRGDYGPYDYLPNGKLEETGTRAILEGLIGFTCPAKFSCLRALKSTNTYPTGTSVVELVDASNRLNAPHNAAQNNKLLPPQIPPVVPSLTNLPIVAPFIPFTPTIAVRDLLWAAAYKNQHPSALYTYENYVQLLSIFRKHFISLCTTFPTLAPITAIQYCSEEPGSNIDMGRQIYTGQLINYTVVPQIIASDVFFSMDIEMIPRFLYPMHLDYIVGILSNTGVIHRGPERHVVEKTPQHGNIVEYSQNFALSPDNFYNKMLKDEIKKESHTARLFQWDVARQGVASNFDVFCSFYHSTSHFPNL